MEISDFIDRVGQKYEYDAELIDALKRCVPGMIEGKSEEDISLLMDTLERVQIYTFDELPKPEEIDAITKSKVNGRNDHMKIITYDQGEYGKVVPPSAYNFEPIFDEDMNIVDRIGFIHITNLYDNSETAKFYGTKINLSHLIHELGHAWAAQKDEFQQDENGDYTISIGAARYHNKVDRKSHTVEETGVDSLYIEEALNSIEEEEALYRVLGIQNFHEIPNYVPSDYQDSITPMMRYYIEKLGKNTFDGIRIQKERKDIEPLQEIFDETAFMKKTQTEEYYTDKGKEFATAQDTSMSDKSKKRVQEFFEKYRDLYLAPPDKSQNFLEHLDRVMEQLYSFRAIKYSYNIFRDDMRDAYMKAQVAILAEGYTPVNQAVAIIEERRKQEEPQVTLSSLAREALEDKIRTGEVTTLDRAEEKSREGTKVVDEPNKG